MSTEDTKDYNTWPPPRQARRVLLVIGLWAWIMGWCLALLMLFSGCGGNNLLDEGHYRTDITWTYSDWSGDRLPVDDIQIWTITGDDDHYRLVLPGSDNVIKGYEVKGEALFTLGHRGYMDGESNTFLQVILQRVDPEDNRAYMGTGEACVWLGNASFCERVEVTSTDYSRL